MTPLDRVRTDWPEYWVTIFRTSDGVEIEHHSTTPWHHATIFWWAEGNGSCDCNRELCFERAQGREPGVQTGTTCGDSRYEITQFRFPDGVILSWRDALEADALASTL
jgi:hypothetical protein